MFLMTGYLLQDVGRTVATSLVTQPATKNIVPKDRVLVVVIVSDAVTPDECHHAANRVYR